MNKTKYTDNQRKAITEHGQNILVSAAAGAGKTAVLVERIIQSLLREEDPIDIDRILVMTFTKAAAGEMRDRILAAINERLREGSANRHLYRQAALIHNAHISTIHGFCLDVIKNHFHRIDLSPDFRTMNEAEGKLMMADALEAVLEEAYEQADPAFLAMSEHIAAGKTDKAVEEAVLNLYQFAISNPDVEAWFAMCLKMYDDIEEATFDDHPMVRYQIEDFKQQVAGLLAIAKKAQNIATSPMGPYMYADMITYDIDTMEALLKAASYSEFATILKSYAPLKLGAAKKTGPEIDPELQETAKQLRTQARDRLRKLQGNLISDVALSVQHMHESREDVASLIAVTRSFIAKFQEMKRKRGLIDFNDMEHFCLKILTENPDIADEYRNFFREIYVDEYQDSNLVQETIVNLIADNNVFDVGDVKQSIYKFRMARPELFLQKFLDYSKGNGGLRIDLHDNFRSRREVIDAVNEVFSKIMCKEIGGIDYDMDAALKYGATYYDPDPNTTEKETQSVPNISVTSPDYGIVTGGCEPTDRIDPDGHQQYVAEYVGILKNDEIDAKELEAGYIAKRISDLISSGMPVYDKEKKVLRPVRYSDIVILLRATKSWDDVFCRVIESHGIPIHAASSAGYFSAREIVWLLSYLQIIDNPLQDIPLAAVLKSPIGRFSDTELACIRSDNKKMPLYQSLCGFASKTTDTVNTPVIEKTKDFLTKLEDFRKKAAYTSVYEILQEIVDGDYGREILASPGGEKGYANLNMLLSQALEFEKTSYRGLFQFVRYIEYLKTNEVDYGEANLVGENDNTVRLMSIHKSKGLEFPVVFLSGMHKIMNFMDAYSSMVLDADLGIGTFCVDSEKRTRWQTLSRSAISTKIQKENLAEEIRILYVAMTRAREKLIMTGMTKTEDTALVRADALQSAKSYLDLLSFAAGEDGFKHIDVKVTTVTDLLDARMGQEIRKEDIRLGMLAKLRNSEKTESSLAARLQFIYPADPNDSYGKISVTELKKRSMQLADAEEFEDGEQTTGETKSKESTSKAPEDPLPIIPAFISRIPADTQNAQDSGTSQDSKTGQTVKPPVSPTLHGTAFHRMLEIWDYTLEPTAESVSAYFAKVAAQKRMEADMLAVITEEEILRFLQTDLATRMREAAGRGELYREQPFVIRMENEMLVQGIIDAFFIEDEQIVVVDYKTDRVGSAKTLTERYHVQLEYYDKALTRLMKLPVKERLIYSAVLNQTIAL